MLSGNTDFSHNLATVHLADPLAAAGLLSLSLMGVPAAVGWTSKEGPTDRPRVGRSPSLLQSRLKSRSVWAQESRRARSHFATWASLVPGLSGEKNPNNHIQELRHQLQPTLTSTPSSTATATAYRSSFSPFLRFGLFLFLTCCRRAASSAVTAAVYLRECSSMTYLFPRRYVE